MSKLDVGALETLLARGMSKSALCIVLGCSRPALRRWLAGVEPLSETTVRHVNQMVSDLLERGGALPRINPLMLKTEKAPAPAPAASPDPEVSPLPHTPISGIDPPQRGPLD